MSHGVGTALYEAYPSVRYAAADGDEYMRLTGTSMAAAVATGVVALMLDANQDAPHGHAYGYEVPTLTPNAVKGLLEITAINVVDPRASATTG